MRSTPALLLTLLALAPAVALASRLERLGLQQGPDPHGDHSQGGLRAPLRLREARDAGQDLLVVLAPPSRHGESRR